MNRVCGPLAAEMGVVAYGGSGRGAGELRVETRDGGGSGDREGRGDRGGGVGGEAITETAVPPSKRTTDGA